MKIYFGRIGVCVEGYTAESLYALFEEHGLEGLLSENCIRTPSPFSKSIYLQSDELGKYVKDNRVTIRSGFIHYVIDMENFLLILRVGILDPDAANSLVDELNLQGLIKPRNKTDELITHLDKYCKEY